MSRRKTVNINFKSLRSLYCYRNGTWVYYCCNGNYVEWMYCINYFSVLWLWCIYFLQHSVYSWLVFQVQQIF